MESAARLKAYVYGIDDSPYDYKWIGDYVQTVEVPEYIPKSGVKISVNDEDAQSIRSDGLYGEFSVLLLLCLMFYYIYLVLFCREKSNCKIDLTLYKML